MAKKWLVLIALAVFAVIYYYIFFIGQDYQPSGDMATATCLKESPDKTAWYPYIMCGLPTVGSLLNARAYNPIITAYDGLFPHDLSEYTWIVPFFLIAGAGIVALLMRLEVGLVPALLCGLFYALNPSMISYADAGHGSKLMTIAFLPWLLFFTDRVWNRQNLMSVLLLAVCFWLQMVSLHVQIAYYGVMMVVFYCLWHKKVWPSVLTAMGLMLGFLLSAPLYMKIYEYSKVSVRGAGGVGWNYATEWSFHPFESITYILPSFFGFGGETYHGYMPFTYAPLYWGIAVLVFSVVAIIWGKSRLKWFLVTLAGLAWVMSFGKYLPVLYAPAYFILPFFNKFRAPMMIQVLVLLPMVVLAGVGMKTAMQKKWGKWLVAVLGVWGLAQFALMGKGIVHPVSAETWREYLKPDSVVEFIQKDSTVFRILPLVRHHNPNWYAAQHLETVLGRAGVNMAVYQAAMDSLFPSWEFLSMANVKYIITEEPQNSPYLDQVFIGDGQYVYLYNRFMPRAWFVRDKGEISWLERSADRNVLYVFTEVESMLFVSQTYHPDWKAKMDGFDCPVEPINGMFTGIIVPAGQHRIELEFDPWRTQ